MAQFYRVRVGDAVELKWMPFNERKRLTSIRIVSSGANAPTKPSK